VSLARRLFTAQGWPYLLVPFIPIALVLDLAGADPVPVFFTSALGVIPTAALMGRATEELAARSGPGIGGLLNVTFGNAPELIIALFALGSGLHEVVKASIIGSILGNTLLVLGAAMFVGGLRRDRQYFDRTAASVQSAMLLLAVSALVMPAIFELVEGRGLPMPGAERVNYDSTVEQLSLWVSLVLILTYAAGLLFSLKTHRDLFNPQHAGDGAAQEPARVPAAAEAPAREPAPAASANPGPHDGDEHGEPWSVRRAVGALTIAGVAVGVMSEVLVGSISEASETIGLSEFFVGVIVVATVGNAAEHWVAVLVAAKDKMDLAVNIAIGSSAQIALFVGPVLVLCSFVLGPHPMALVFNGFELGAILLAVVIANHVTNEGESTWFEGLQLLAVYLVFGLAFFFA
jgi:Ca2+:H+ antiporter